MLLSEHVYCVAITFKMTEWVEQWICINFCVKLEHSFVEIISMIQKATAMGNWWLAASSRQFTHSWITSHVEFFGETSNHPGDSAPLQLRLLAFPKTKITFEREEVSDHWWDSGKYNRATDGDWENCVRSQGDYTEGDWSVVVLCTVFLVSCILYLLQKMSLFFILHGWIPSGQTTHTHTTHRYLPYFLILLMLPNEVYRKET